MVYILVYLLRPYTIIQPMVHKKIQIFYITNTIAVKIARQFLWANKNNQIVFAYKRFGAYQIWTMTDNGLGQQQIVRSGQQYWNYLPVWSPDDKSVIFTQRSSEGPVMPWEMFISYENRNKAVASLLNLKPLPVENVHYSPDGLWIVFEGISTDNNRDIFYALTNGDQRTQLTKDPGVDFDPVWRPLVKP